MGTMEDIKNYLHKNNELLSKNNLLLRQSLNLDVRPHNWHKTDTLTSTTEVPFDVKREFGKIPARFLRIKVDKNATLKLEFEQEGDKKTWEEGLKANKPLIFNFKPSLTLKRFHIKPDAADTTYWLWASTIENPITVETDLSHLDGDTFTAASKRAVLIAGQDGTDIQVIKVDSAGHFVMVIKPFGFTAQDLTINDASITADGSFKEFDITADIDAQAIPNSVIITQILITQLTFANNMNIIFQIWEKDSAGYVPTTRADLYLKVLERDIINTDGEWSEIIEGILLYRDRDDTGELHCRLVNNVGGEASDFAVVIKGKLSLDSSIVSPPPV